MLKLVPVAVNGTATPRIRNRFPSVDLGLENYEEIFDLVC